MRFIYKNRGSKRTSSKASRATSFKKIAMKGLFHVLWLTSLVVGVPSGDQSTGIDDTLQTLKQTVSDLGRQLMLQQLFLEEKIRSDGDSGIKQKRLYNDGTVPYYGDSHTGASVSAIHDHANYDRTVGMGEVVIVMNGVEFRTRHNDYKLVMPSRSSTMYHAVENVPFPDVPPEVLSMPTVAGQITEMREWFRAWADENFHLRDYRKYFKPVLCYMEGAWTTNTKSLDEPFQSDRHHVDASNWFDLQEKIRYTSFSGSKNILENYAYLPTTIMAIQNGIPHFAQWNYRILCHPLKKNVPLSYLKPVDELKSRLSYHRTLEKQAKSKSARFILNSRSRDHYRTYGFLDEIMNGVPGMDNYPGKLSDDSLGHLALDISKSNSTTLNAAYYHGWFKVAKNGGIGLSRIHRGFADKNLYVAKTTHPQIANMSVKDCQKDPHTHQSVCTTYTGKYTYAIPLEIIYLTPLSKWNPYNLTENRCPSVSANGRNGGLTTDKAYNGFCKVVFYKTPAEFFHGDEVQRDAADTAKGVVGVLDPQGKVDRVVSSGMRIFLPNIAGVGILRQRYPIMPVHGEGSGVWKEVDAIKDMLMHMNSYQKFFVEKPVCMGHSSTLVGMASSSEVHFRTSPATQTPPGLHTHDVSFNQAELNAMKNQSVKTYTTHNNGHSHEVEVTNNAALHKYIITLCDGQPVCWDGHSRFLQMLHNP